MALHWKYSLSTESEKHDSVWEEFISISDKLRCLVRVIDELYNKITFFIPFMVFDTELQHTPDSA